MASNPFMWRSCGLTTVGAVRKHNEDSYLALPEQRLWVVADGMGGHSKGDVASQAVAAAYASFEPKRTLSQTVDDLEDRLIKVNQQLRESAGSNPKDMMGSTVVMMYSQNKYAYFLWAGDSRLYRLRKGKLIQVSHDHSYVQESVDKGTIHEDDAANHPSANIITRAVGVHEDIFLDIDYAAVEVGDKYLLCSDGLFKDVTLKEIATELENIPYKAAEGLIAQALARNVNDNVTVIVIEAAENPDYTADNRK